MKKRVKKQWKDLGFCLMAAAGALFAGILVSGMREYFQAQAGILSEFSFRQLKYQEFPGEKLFPYFLGKRMKWAAILPVFSYLEHFFYLALALFFWLGFSFGLLFGILAVKFGTVGVVMGFLMAMPQSIFYGLGFFFYLKALLWWNEEKNDWRIFPGKELFFGIAVVFLGILTESYVNPFFVRLALGLL